MDVVQLGIGSFLRFANLNRVKSLQLRYLALRVVPIAGYDGMGRANIDAGWLEAYLYAVRTVVAFRRCLAVRVDMNGIVGASLHTGLTPDAPLRVEINDSVVAGEQRGDRANGHAGGIGAVVTPHHAEGTVGRGKGALFDVLDPCTVDADGRVVFRLAGHRAGVAADALAVIDNESVVHNDEDGNPITPGVDI